MAEYISREAAVDSDRRKKIKTPFAKIFVSDNPEKTYYYIMWWQDEEMQIGFGSANLLFVRQWLRDEFEVENPAADVAPVVRCRDCKWFANNNDGEWYGCWLFNAIRAVPEDAPTPDDFCSYGARKEPDE